MSPSPIVIGEYRFDPQSGEIRRNGESSEEAIRLQPQPALLLTLLAEKNGALLTRDEIRSALWPDVQVDFDRSVNFCVHQLRSALGDKADSPSYIETLPRRGYRLKRPAAAVAPAVATPPAGGFLGRGGRWLIPVAAALVLLAGVAVVGRQAMAPPPAPRLAIMPFEPPAGAAIPGRPEQIATRVLVDLGNLGPEVVEVMGPATTAPYAAQPALRPMLDEIELDYVLNGRFIAPAEDDSAWTLLVELIRASDGAHVWVERVVDCSDPGAIAERAVAAVREEVGLAPPPPERRPVAQG